MTAAARLAAESPTASGAPLVTARQLAAIYRCPLERAAPFAPLMSSAMAAHAITTPARVAAWLAQVGHESGRLRYLAELWGPTSAQLRYEGRADLGNTEPGDGERYRGRGLIQITGRANYASASEALGEDFVSRPQLLETPHWATVSAAWWWAAHGLNELADAGTFDLITRRINGAQTGRTDRVALHLAARQILAEEA